MKPFEFKIEEKYDEVFEDNIYEMVFFYEDKTTNRIEIPRIPEGLELNKHYSITDIYGYTVIDGR